MIKKSVNNNEDVKEHERESGWGNATRKKQ